MSIDLVNLSFIQKDLTPSEKHLLTILCFRADSKTFKCWPSFKSLMHDSGYSRDTINRILGELRRKEKILDSGEKMGKTKSIVVYEIIISKQSDVRTPKQYDSLTPSDGKQSDGAFKQSDSRTPKQSDGKYRKDHIIKDQRKECFSKSSGPKILKTIIDKLKTGS